MMQKPASMMAVVTKGNGGYEMLEYKSVPTPNPGANEVLLKVLAAGINNTEINTRLGWYSSSVSEATATASSNQVLSAEIKPDGGWKGATPFPLIQGTDCCGEVVELGAGAPVELLGKRCLVRSCMRLEGFGSLETIWMASDFDGAFAEYVKVPASEVFPINCNWRDEELATIPCAYGTSENMLHRANVRNGETVLVTGASGGVGSATVQLAKRRGAKVIAITSLDKAQVLKSIGADRVLPRDANLLEEVRENGVDVVVDNVAGTKFGEMIKLLRKGGRVVSSGAIAGPLVGFDMRDMYLKDISILGSTAWDEPVFPNLIGYVEREEIQPLLAQTYPLSDIVEAQKAFMKKEHIGKFVLIPPNLHR